MKKTGKQFLEYLIQFLPLIGLVFIFLITQNEWIVSVIILAIMVVLFKIKYYKNEWALFFIGILIGVIFELAGDMIYKLQYWENGSFFGIPSWLPLFWGCGFVFIRRLGNIIVNKDKK